MSISTNEGAKFRIIGFLTNQRLEFQKYLFLANQSLGYVKFLAYKGSEFENFGIRPISSLDQSPKIVKLKFSKTSKMEN